MNNTKNRKLQDWLKAYLQYTQFNESPEHFHFWTGVGTIAGALRGKVWVDELYYRWYPNFYIILVAPPGIAAKSTAISIGRSFLQQIGDVKFGPDAMTPAALITALDGSREYVQMPDGTLFPTSSLSFFSSELGSLINFRDRDMVIALTDLWDGKEGAWRKSTKTMGSEEIYHPWVNIVAGTTPAWLTSDLPREMIGGGFTSRCLFLFANQKRRIVPFPSRIARPTWVSQLQSDLLHDLEQISLMRGPFTVTEEAYRVAEEWYKELVKKMTKPDEAQAMIVREQAQSMKLSMVISASKRQDMLIQPDDMQAAIALITALEKDAMSVFQLVRTTEPMEHVLRLAELVAQSPRGIQRAALYRRHFMRTHSFKEFIEAVDSALQAGLIEQVLVGGDYLLRGRKAADSSDK